MEFSECGVKHDNAVHSEVGGGEQAEVRAAEIRHAYVLMERRLSEEPVKLVYGFNLPGHNLLRFVIYSDGYWYITGRK